MMSLRNLQYNQDGLDPFFYIEEHCFQGTRSGHGKCLDRHTSQYEYCAERPTSDRHKRTEFCYYNGGNYNQANQKYKKIDDAILFNRYERKLPARSQHWINAEETAVNSLCEPICRNQYGWDLPVMKPWKPTKHGVVKSRHQLMTDIEDVPLHYGNGGEWPPDALKTEDHSAELAEAYHQMWQANPPWVETSEEMLLGWPNGGGNPGEYSSDFPTPPWNIQRLWAKVEPIPETPPPPPPPPPCPADAAWQAGKTEPWGPWTSWSDQSNCQLKQVATRIPKFLRHLRPALRNLTGAFGTPNATPKTSTRDSS
ncbi:MAG: hypothetical protein Q9181_002535 [Wetmoreana brouardii]